MSKPKQNAAVIPAPRASAEDQAPAPRPGWQTRSCPAWCEVIHRDGDHHDDRNHFATPVGKVELSLYAAEHSGRGWALGSLDLALSQHYRHAEPEIDLTVPLRTASDPEVIGETELMLTLAEARILRDKLTALLAIAEGDTAPALGEAGGQ